MKRALTLFLLFALALPQYAENWMKRLPDNAYVATLSIPGSHDTGTGNGFPGSRDCTSFAPPTADFARCSAKHSVSGGSQASI